MTAQQTVALYYDAWRNRRGDFSDVPLAVDFQFVGPVASFDSAAGYREMAGQAGQAVTSFEVRVSSSTATPCARSSTGRWRGSSSVAGRAPWLGLTASSRVFR